MDPAIADSINRRDARLITEHLDLMNLGPEYNAPPWYRSPIAETLMDSRQATASDRAWLIGAFAARTPGIAFDGAPADCDWDNLFSHFRAEIAARRDPQTPSVHASESVRDGVGSR